MWRITSFGDELTGDFCDGFEAISIGDFGLFYRLAGKIVSRILGLLQQYRPLTTHRGLSADGRFRGEADKYEHRPWPFQSRMTHNRHSAIYLKCRRSVPYRLSHWSDLRHSHWLGHAVENYNALAAAARRQRLGRLAIASVNVLPVVRHPDVARRIDVDIDLHL